MDERNAAKLALLNPTTRTKWSREHNLDTMMAVKLTWR